MRSGLASRKAVSVAASAAFLWQAKRHASTGDAKGQETEMGSEDGMPAVPPAGVEFRTSPSPLSSSCRPTPTAAAEGAIDPYAFARGDHEAMEKLRKEFDKVLLGPMPVANKASDLPRKIGGAWLDKEEQRKVAAATAKEEEARLRGTSSSSSAVAVATHSHANALSTPYNYSVPQAHQADPFMPPLHVPHESEVQGSFARYEAKTAEEEREEMLKRMEMDDALKRSGRLFKIHEACKRREDVRVAPAGESEKEAQAAQQEKGSEPDLDDIDMMMGATTISSPQSSTTTSSASEVISGIHADHPDAFAPFWDTFKSKNKECAGDGKAPEWFVALCKDLFLRTTSSTAALTPPSISGGGEHKLLGSPERGTNQVHDEVITDEELEILAYESEVVDPTRLANSGLLTDSEDGPAVDPYLWLPFNLRSERDYIVSRYTFPTETSYSTETKLKLSAGGLSTEYVCFCDTYAFTDRKQLPTSVGTVPSRLWVKPEDTSPVVYLQLGEHIPPSMWLPIKPTALAVRRVLAEFAMAAATHRDTHHEQFEERLKRAEIILRNNNMPTDDGSLLRFASLEAKDVNFYVAPTREFPNYQEFFLGEYDDPNEIVSFIQSCPLLFAMPHMQQSVDVHDEEHVPTITGPGVGMGIYRTLYSKSSLLLKIHLATEVKLPPQDLEGFELLWREAEGRVVPKSRIPVFARIMWPDHQRMAGGGKIIERFNKLFNTEFAPQMPVDAAMSVFYAMEWAKQREHNFLGIRGMRRRLDALLEAAQSPQPALLYPGTSELPNPQYTNDELIGMHIQYLAHLGDPEAGRAIEALWQVGSAPVRMGCAKAALEIGDRELFRTIVSSEPAGRMQHYMTRLVVKRKTRDLTAKVPKLMEDQYEFGAPLWARGGHVRLDTNTIEGSIDINRLQKTHRSGS